MTVVNLNSADLIHLVSRRADCAQVRLGDCETVITLRVSTDHLGAVRLAQSHWICPPDANASSRTKSFPGIEFKHVLGAAIGQLAAAFARGLRQGHRPDETWFVPVPVLVG